MADLAVTKDTPFVEADDTFHTLSDDPYEVETNWWCLNWPGRRMGAWLHTGVKPNQKTFTSRIFVWDEKGSDPQRLAYYNLLTDQPMPENPDLRDITFPNGGYRLKMQKPLMDYYVTYADSERNFSIEFEFKAVHPPHRFTPGEPPAMFNPHLDQLGKYTGVMNLAGEKIDIDCWSVRDRTWGPRGGAHSQSQKKEYLEGKYRVRDPGGPIWRQVERERGRGRVQYIFGHTDDQTGFLSFCRPQDGDSKGWSPMNMGWLLKDGTFGRLDKTQSAMKVYRNRDTGWSEHMEVRLADDRGRSMEAEGFAVSYMCENQAGATALMRWEYDGKIGWGEDQDGWNPQHFQKMLRAMRDTGLGQNVA